MKFLVLQHIACEELGRLGKVLSSAGIDIENIFIHQGQPLPKNLKNYQGLIVLGGPMNVYEEKKFPFLVKEGILLKEAVEKGIPTLGICLGAQLIAKACGAIVTRSVQKEIGWYEIQLTHKGQKDGIFTNFPEKFTAFQWHGDTFEIPSGAQHLASSNLFPHQAFRISNAYAIQFHLEAEEEMIFSWVHEYEEELKACSYINAGNVLKVTKTNLKSLNSLADIFYQNFLRLL